MSSSILVKIPPKRIALVVGSAVIILMSSLTVLGYLGYIYVPWVGARIKNVSYEVVNYEGTSALSVQFSTNVYPIEVVLLGQGPEGPRSELDRTVVYGPQDIPAHLFFAKFLGYPIPGYNVPHGTYYLVFMYKGGLVLEQRIRIKGPSLTIKDADLEVKYKRSYHDVGWSIENITLTVQNTGDCPAFIQSVRLYITELNETLGYSTSVAIGKGETSTFTAKYSGWGIPIRSPGTYHARVIVSLDSTETAYETTFTTPTPRIEIVSAIFYYTYYPTFDEYDVTSVDITVRNTGSVPAYIFSVKVTFVGYDWDIDYFSDPVVVSPETTTTFSAIIYIYALKSGTYTVVIEMDIGYTTLSFSGQVTLTPP